MTTKGYVVRGKGREGRTVTPLSDTGTAEHSLRVVSVLSEGATYSTPDAALGIAVEMVRDFEVTDVSIFRVHADGREERLPSYEEALGELERLRAADRHCAAPNCSERTAKIACSKRCSDNLNRWFDVIHADPLAALEAAERRLLEAGGWVQAPRPGIWTDPCGGNCSVTDAVYAEKRRLAAKGGA